MNGFLSLVRFTTRLPLGKDANFSMEEMGKSMKYFPIVGIIIGLILYIFKSVLGLFVASPLVIAAMVAIVYVVLTGAIHLDGLSDTFDGIFSYRSKQRMLEIMKDSRIGVNGAIALILYFILKISLLAELEVDSIPIGPVLLLFPVLGRMSSVVNCATAEYARNSGMAKSFVDNTNINGFVTSFLITLLYSFGIITYFNITLNVILIVPIIAIIAYYFAKLMTKKIGGITGDTLGAVLEFTQLVSIFLFYVLL